CTITLKDVQLQLGLLVDGSVLTRSAQSVDWRVICYDLLGVIPNNTYEGWAYILEIIGSYLMLDLSRNLVHLRWLLKLVDFRATGELSWGSVHVKVSLVNYATVDMHQTDRVLRQFGFQQPILVTPVVLDNEHEINLRQSNMHWPDPWQVIFVLGRAKASANLCRKGTMRPFKSKEKG
ncbi:hypothetical protein Godav_029243, partial [Gossypium davidsonii]|nr:hypothetical protein [Gossypium davidsonii]